MANFTATPQNGTAVFSANGMANTLTFKLSGTDQQLAPISGKLWADQSMTIPAGWVAPVTSASTASGSIGVQAIASQSGVLYLVLHNDAKSTDSDPVAITAEALTSVTISATPSYIQPVPPSTTAPQITLTANIVDAQGGKQPSSLRLVWNGVNPEDKKYIDSTTAHTTNHDQPSTFNTTTKTISDDVKLLGGALQVRLDIGPDNAPLSIFYDVAVVQLGALIPGMPNTTIIDDNKFNNAHGGFPYNTPDLSGLELKARDNLIVFGQLGATYQPSTDLWITSYPCNTDNLIDGTVQVVLDNDPAHLSPIFTSNWDPINIYYQISGPNVNQSCSDPLSLIIELSQNEGNDYPTDKELPPPVVTPKRYMKPNYDAKRCIAVSIDLSQYTRMKLNDEITVEMQLWGYTNDTLGKSAAFSLGPYRVNHTDLTAKKVVFANATPGQIDSGFTYDMLGTLLSGYSGVVRYNYKSKDTGNTHTCTQPAPVLVNVSLVYSGGWNAQAFIEAHGNTLPHGK